MAAVAFAVEGDGVGFATESYAASALCTTLASLSGTLWRIRRAIFRAGAIDSTEAGDQQRPFRRDSRLLRHGHWQLSQLEMKAASEPIQLDFFSVWDGDAFLKAPPAAKDKPDSKRNAGQNGQ
jgi:hypothetical protein